ncbi:hypothetical protein GN958_ATG16022, partial [Phytophthora infestans]
ICQQGSLSWQNNFQLQRQSSPNEGGGAKPEVFNDGKNPILVLELSMIDDDYVNEFNDQNPTSETSIVPHYGALFGVLEEFNRPEK